MTDKVQKILSEIATRKLCTMDEHMAFYNDKAKEDYLLLSEIEEFIKASQEEPVSIWHDVSTPPNDKNADRDIYIVTRNQNNRLETWHIFSYMTWEWVEGHVDGKVVSWAYLKDLLNLTHSELTKISDHVEPVTEELGDYINELSKQFQEVSFAKLSRIAIRVANWQKKQMMKDAVEREVFTSFGGNIVVKADGLSEGDKVKLIIIKED